MPYDKVLHMSCSAILAFCFTLISSFSTSVQLTGIIGVAKESSDALGFGDPDPFDMLANIAGITVGVVLAFTATYMFQLIKRISK